MAIDRNIIEWSNTAKVFKAKSYVDIFNMLVENYQAIYGADIDLTVETAFGEELRMQAEQLYDFAKLAEDVYYTLDINNASGAILDNLVAFTSNLIRQANVQTILTGELTITGGIGVLDLASSSVYVQDDSNELWRADAIDEADAEITINIPKTVKLTAISYGELQVTSLTQLLVNGSYITNSLSLGTIIYTQLGSIEETDAMLRQRKNNTLSYNTKSLLDSMRDYILKNIVSIKDVKIYNANGRKTSDSDVDVDGNTLINILTPAASPNDVENIYVYKHDLLVIVQPQTGIAEQSGGALDSFRTITDSPSPGDYDPTELSIAIAQVLKDKITPGIATVESIVQISDDTEITDATRYIEVLIAESVGDSNYYERYSFYVAYEYNPTITINLLTKNNYDSTTTQARIRQALYDLSTNYIINQNISLDEVLTAIKNSNLDLNNPTFSIAGVQVADGSNSALKAYNGYWLVDQNSESDTGLADWNIVIEEELE